VNRGTVGHSGWRSPVARPGRRPVATLTSPWRMLSAACCASISRSGRCRRVRSDVPPRTWRGLRDNDPGQHGLATSTATRSRCLGDWHAQVIVRARKSSTMRQSSFDFRSIPFQGTRTSRRPNPIAQLEIPRLLMMSRRLRRACNRRQPLRAGGGHIVVSAQPSTPALNPASNAIRGTRREWSRSPGRRSLARSTNGNRHDCFFLFFFFIC